MSMVDSFEKIPVRIYPDQKEGSKFAAREIADLIRSKQAAGQPLCIRPGNRFNTAFNVCRTGTYA